MTGYFVKVPIYTFSFKNNSPGPVGQSVASPIADPGVMSLIPARNHTLMKIDCDIYSLVIFLLSLIQEGLLSVTSKSMCTEYWLTAYSRKSVVRLTDHLDMTITVDRDIKPQTNKNFTSAL